MSESRFILEQMYNKLKPSYGLLNAVPLAGRILPRVDFEQPAEALSDEQLEEVLATNILGVPMTFPLYFAEEGGPWWLLPYEPQVTINGTNVLVKKQVAKGAVRGTIKERWAQGDYRISINGILMGADKRYPSEDVKQLRSFCEGGKILVKSPQMELFSITQIVVEDWSIPFTSGKANQAYSINAVSDDIYKLLLREDDLRQV
jgi:hypothetical protein